MNFSRLFKVSTALSTKILINPRKYSNITSTVGKKLKNNEYSYKCKHFYQLQAISTLETKDLQKEENAIKKLIKKIPFFNVEKSRMLASGYLLYEGVADKINYITFFDELNLPDTFYSWFVITELHIWMISVRAMAEGDDGKILRNALIEALWADVNQRVKKLGAHNPSVTRSQVAELAEQLQAALIAYDEGLQSDDRILAGALWRRFYQQRDVEPEYLDVLVKYVRKQIRLLDLLSKNQLLSTEPINWEPLKKK